MRKADGFPNETLITLPLEDRRRLEADPLSRNLYLTDVGYFPKAAGHYRSRPLGCEQSILILCSEGQGFCRVDGGPRLDVGPRDLVVIGEGLPHQYGADGQNPWTIFWLHFRGKLSRAFLGDSPGPTVRRLSPERSARAQGAFSDLISLAKEGRFVSTRLVSGALWWLSALLLEGERPRALASPEDRALSLMRSRLADPPTLAEIAEASGLSISQISARFKARTGYPPLSYFTRLRMQKACALLSDPALSVQGAAARLGYEDPLHFSRVFKRVIGVSPRQYRREPRA